jgi:chemotaxis protein CheZ
MTDESKKTIAEMAERLAKMEKFITRRFDEVSAEIHATCQMLDMAESGISTRFNEILGVLSAITFHGDGTSPHNVGMELDAVVKTTEDAANRILDAAEEISAMIKQPIWETSEVRAANFQKIKLLTDDILTACAFQDLTGQRIGKTLENIRKAESELTEMLKKMGLNVDLSALNSHAGDDVPKAANQDDVDALFSDARKQ